MPVGGGAGLSQVGDGSDPGSECSAAQEIGRWGGGGGGGVSAGVSWIVRKI